MSEDEPKETKPASERIAQWLFEPKDIASMVFLRIMFGLILTYEALHYFQKDWIAEYFIDPDFHFKYPFFEWVHPLPGIGMYIVFAVMGLASFFMAIGFLYRISSVTFTVLFIYMFTIDAARYLNHFYLVALLGIILSVIPAHRAFSVDAMIWPKIKSNTLPAWCLYLFRYQIFIVYFFGGVHKLNPDWLHGEPMREMLWGVAYKNPSFGEILFNEPIVYFFVLGGMLLDLFIVPAMLWKVTRIPAFLAALGFHLANTQIFTIGIFPWFMICATLMFFPPDWPRRILRRPKIEPAETAPAKFTPGRIAMASALVLYAVVQFAIPWRPYLHGDHPLAYEDVLWFSWNMMLVRRQADVEFRVVDNDTGEAWTVDPAESLSPLQKLVALPKPGNVHQLAIHIAEEAEKVGHKDVSVYADYSVALNARQPQVRIDPTVDLANTPQSLGVKPWELPLEEKTPPAAIPRRDFMHARWLYMKEKGYLPFNLDSTVDEEVMEDIHRWNIEYLRSRGIAPQASAGI